MPSIIARRALNLAREHGVRGHEAWILRLLGDLHAGLDSPNDEEAEVHYSRALSRADEIDMRPLAAHCRQGLGWLHNRMGRADEAHAEHAVAAGIYQEMGMAIRFSGAGVP